MSPGETDWRSPAEKAAKYLVKGSAAHMNGHINGHGNGRQGNGTVTHPGTGGQPHGDSDDEEFHPPEPTRTGSSNEDFFDAAEDGLEEYLSSEEDFHNTTPAMNGSSRAAPTRGRRTSYRDLVARIQEESRRRAAAEEALAACTKRLDGIEAAVAEAQKTLVGGSLIVRSSAGSGDGQGGNEDRTPGREKADNEDAARSRSVGRSQDGPMEADATGIGGVSEESTGSEGGSVEPTGSVSVESALARAVAAAVKRGEEHLVEDKEQADLAARKEAEMSRLRDKLQYWERMNQEMAQKNNEAIEHMRAHRRRWNVIWRAMGVGAAVTVGVGVMVAVAHLSSSSSSDGNGNNGSSNGSIDGAIRSSNSVDPRGSVSAAAE
ncbi:hypothetical protein CLOM_g6641 [Closterium sp. NIES-68]|nr:hypothetical protein CLOM_g6641 [Closterium sp. NIES-68]GJP57632.1 hypothetical protein CLOP_g10408 [Closterium sp. NIES-67]GJP75906.1 hypothetical protein CLOP_g6307 [Closterium sp. NIES-67]